jgi:hypothetical protein
VGNQTIDTWNVRGVKPAGSSYFAHIRFSGNESLEKNPQQNTMRPWRKRDTVGNAARNINCPARREDLKPAFAGRIGKSV